MPEEQRVGLAGSAEGPDHDLLQEVGQDRLPPGQSERELGEWEPQQEPHEAQREPGLLDELPTPLEEEEPQVEAWHQPCA